MEHKNLFFRSGSGYGYEEWEWSGGQSPEVEVHSAGGQISSLCLTGVMHIQYERSEWEVKVGSRAVEGPVEVVK